MAPHFDNITISGGKSVSPATVQINVQCGPEGTQLVPTHKAANLGFVTYQSSHSPHSTASSSGDSDVECVGQHDLQQQMNIGTIPQHGQAISYMPGPNQQQVPATQCYSPVTVATTQYAVGPAPMVAQHRYPATHSGQCNPSNLGNSNNYTHGLSVVVDDHQSHMVPQMHQAPPPTHMQQYVPYQPIQQQPLSTGLHYSTHNLQGFRPQFNASYQPFMTAAYNNQAAAPPMVNAHQAVQPPNYFSSSLSASSGSSSPASQYTPQPDVAPVSVSRTLEKIWESEFQNHFCQFPISWILSPSATVPPTIDEANVDPNEPEMRTYMDSAKVRFICPNCKHCWTSMKGRVQFGYVISKDQTGLVVFKLFGQKCQNCEHPEWVHAMWYAEEIRKAIYNVCQKVGQAFYDWKKPVVRLDRRPGRPSKPHNTDSCQACSQGICKEEKNFA